MGNAELLKKDFDSTTIAKNATKQSNQLLDTIEELPGDNSLADNSLGVGSSNKMMFPKTSDNTFQNDPKRSFTSREESSTMLSPRNML